jgi:putative transposase
MRELGLRAKKRKKFYRSYKGEVGHVAANLINRQFDTEKPNEVWLTDVTEFKVKGQKLYLSAILDVFNREIIGHSISKNPNFELVKESFDKAIKQTKKADEPLKTIVHSDQGWLYQIKSFQRLLAPHQMSQSMSRKGNCLDNALMEGFFGILKNECIYQTDFQSVEDAIQQVNRYIKYYNINRIKQKLKGQSPVQYRNRYEIEQKAV